MDEFWLEWDWDIWVDRLVENSFWVYNSFHLAIGASFSVHCHLLTGYLVVYVMTALIKPRLYVDKLVIHPSNGAGFSPWVNMEGI